MIAYLKGEIFKKSLDYIILNVNGVGYKVFTPLSTLCSLNDSPNIIELFIETIVREDDIRLFGFLTEREKDVFNKLISVSKIGPKLAIAILSSLDIDKIIYAITKKDLKILSSVPGVGKKTAERIFFDLKDKFDIIDSSVDNGGEFAIENKFEDIVSALTNLGYKSVEVKNITEKILKVHSEESIENIIKIILNELYNG